MNHILSKIFYGPIFFKGNKKITSEIFASFPKCGATVLDFHQQSIGIPVNYPADCASGVHQPRGPHPSAQRGPWHMEDAPLLSE